MQCLDLDQQQNRSISNDDHPVINIRDIDQKKLKHVLAGKIIIDTAPSILQILGLGSCVAVTFFFPKNKIGGMAHVVLPARTKEEMRTHHLVGKYANTAIEYLVTQFEKKKLNFKEVVIKLVGGSQMFGNNTGKRSILNIAERNIASIKEELQKYDLTIKKTDLGGFKGRSIFFDLENGNISIFFAGGKPKTMI